MKTKKIWSKDTAEKIAAAKTAKHGMWFTVVAAKGGGFNVVAGEPETDFWADVSWDAVQDAVEATAAAMGAA